MKNKAWLLIPLVLAYFAIYSVSNGATPTQDSASNSTGSAVPAWAFYMGANQGGNLVGLVADPCQSNAKVYVSISQTANTKLVTGTSAKKIYPCDIHLVVAGADNVALVEGTGAVCATGTTGVTGFGGATAATGWNLAANGGLTFGSGGYALGAEGTNADDLCLFVSTAVQVSGGISYVVQ